jgi:hypothetical protein
VYNEKEVKIGAGGIEITIPKNESESYVGFNMTVYIKPLGHFNDVYMPLILNIT